jgi:apocytochrome f
VGLTPLPTAPASAARSPVAHLRTMRRLLSCLNDLPLRAVLAAGLCLGVLLSGATPTWAYPFWAQQNYASPREATGKIVCANCHLAKKATRVEVPQAVFPDTVFKAVVEVPYDTSVQQPSGDGSPTGLNVGAVVMLPDGFRLAPPERLSEELKEETQGIYYTQYSDDQPNILLVGPIPGDQHQEIVFPILSPDPSQDSSIHFGKYQLHVGGNRGRGQVTPEGVKTNNNVFTAPVAGRVNAISAGENGASVVEIQAADGTATSETIPAGPALTVAVGEAVEAGAPLTTDPNVGGFGQIDAEVVLQNPVRIYGLLAFFAAVALAQIMLVLKKRQVEKVQAAEGI